MTSLSSKKPLETQERKLADILYIEDSNADIALTTAILKRKRIYFELHFLRDGQEAINLLGSEDPFVEELDLILLDFNLPKRNGMEVLSFLKSNPKTRHIPVIMLSGSDSPLDMSQAKELGAHNYIVKPIDEDNLENAVKGLSSIVFTREGDEKYLYADS